MYTKKDHKIDLTAAVDLLKAETIDKEDFERRCFDAYRKLHGPEPDGTQLVVGMVPSDNQLVVGWKQMEHYVVDTVGGALGSLKYTCNCGEEYAVLPDGPGSAVFRMMDGRQDPSPLVCPKAAPPQGC